MNTTKRCRHCDCELIPGKKKDGGNWPPSYIAAGNFICRLCQQKVNARTPKAVIEPEPTGFSCDYCLDPLVLGYKPYGNWTAQRQAKREFICRPCASKIATGQLSRSARLKITDEASAVLQGVGERLRGMLTPAMVASLAKPYDTVVTTIRLPTAAGG